jgi:hypothetical protein
MKSPELTIIYNRQVLDLEQFDQSSTIYNESVIRTYQFSPHIPSTINSRLRKDEMEDEASAMGPMAG